MENIQNIEPNNFRKYGKIIEYPNKSTKGTKRNLWRIVHSEKANTGWRIAYLVLRDRTIGRLECHPDSDETFEPVAGRALLFVALSKRTEDIRCFKLERPVVLNKGVWHGLVTISAETEIKIAENNEVKSLYWPLGTRIAGLNDIRKKINPINPA